MAKRSVATSKVLTRYPNVCEICLIDKDCEVDLGVLYKTDQVTVHYFCLVCFRFNILRFD